MFSGIVEGIAQVTSIVHAQASLRLSVHAPFDVSEISIGDSISIEGACLTVIDRVADTSLLSFDVAPETLRKTALGQLSVGASVNIERSLRMGERIHGHMVSGHVDAAITLLEKVPEDNTLKLKFELPEVLRPFVAPKCSITLAGVSLTVGEVHQNAFSVYVVPHTANVTTLGSLALGNSVNCEIDMLARYVVQYLNLRGS